MIKFREQVPAVYTDASRDFQYLSWLIDIVLNSVKHNVDSLYDLPNATLNPKLAELLAITLGFKVKRNYDQTQLAALVAVLPRILKYKGTITAVNMAGEALIAASGASGTIVSSVNGGVLEVSLPKNLVDISLFTDLLTYILPAGMTCRIIRTDYRKSYYTTDIGHNDIVVAKLVPDLAWDETSSKVTGLATMFTDGTPIFTNFDGYDTNSLSTGLLSNNVIPSLASHVVSEPTLVADYNVKQNSSGTTVTVNKYTTAENDDGETVIIGGN